MDDWNDPHERPTPAVALAAMPGLVGESLQVIHQAETLAARLRVNNLKLGQALAALTGGTLDTTAPASINLTISLPYSYWPRVEQTISRLQARHAAMGIDDCLNDAFCLGMDNLLGPARDDPDPESCGR